MKADIFQSDRLDPNLFGRSRPNNHCSYTGADIDSVRKAGALSFFTDILSPGADFDIDSVITIKNCAPVVTLRRAFILMVLCSSFRGDLPGGVPIVHGLNRMGLLRNPQVTYC